MNLAQHSTHDLKDVPSVLIAMLMALGAQEWIQILLESKLAASIGAAVITILFNVWRYIVDKRDPYKEKYIKALESKLAEARIEGRVDNLKERPVE